MSKQQQVVRKADIVRTYIQWYRSGEIPSCEDLHTHFPTFTVEQIFNFLHTSKVYSYLAERNIPAPPRQKSRKSLTDRQIEWIEYCTNPYTKMSLSQMCSSFGITTNQHAAWMRQAHFKREYEKIIQAKVSGTEGEIFRRTASKAVNEGDVKATELLYRMSGKPIPQALTQSDSSNVPLEAVIRAMQEICTPDQLAAVSAKLLMGPTPQEPPALPVHSEEI